MLESTGKKLHPNLARFADISVMSAIKKEEGSNLFIQHASLDPPSCFVQSISVI